MMLYINLWFLFFLWCLCDNCVFVTCDRSGQVRSDGFNILGRHLDRQSVGWIQSVLQSVKDMV